jgi:hypothetical protein
LTGACAIGGADPNTADIHADALIGEDTIIVAFADVDSSKSVVKRSAVAVGEVMNAEG